MEIQLKDDSGVGRDTYSHSLVSVGSADISDAPGLSLHLLEEEGFYEFLFGEELGAHGPDPSSSFSVGSLPSQ